MSSATSKVLPLAATAAGYYFGGPMGALVGGAIGSGVSAATAKTPDIPAPTPSTPAQAPSYGDSSQQVAQKSTLAALQRRQGRASSILTQGGLDNQSSKLGG